MNFTSPHLPTITARASMVHGDRDPLYPVRLELEMREAIPRSYLWAFSEGGHGPIFGEMSDRFVETCKAFLKGREEPAP